MSLIDDTEIPYRAKSMLRLHFNLNEKYIIHKRKVYNSMDFLGDAGGVFGSMILIGKALHYLIVSNEKPQ